MHLDAVERGLRDRLWVIDIPIAYQNDLSLLIMKWVRCSGVEWAIKRLKALKVDLFRVKASLEPLSWIRKNRKGQWAGTIGSLFRWAQKSDRNFSKVTQAFMAYTMFYHSVPTKSQIEKFSTALRCQPPHLGNSLDHMYKMINHHFGNLDVDRSSDVSLLLYRGSPSKRKPSLGLRSVPQDQFVLEDAEAIVEHSWGRCLVSQFQCLFDPVFEGIKVSPISLPFGMGEKRVGDPCNVIGGKIAFIQEAGGKLRSVASPYLAYQLALRHFGLAVYRLINHLPWDCTHDQSRPVSTLQDHLAKGDTVHSVDLSSATDYFPLEVQSRTMISLFGNIPDIGLMEVLSRAMWISPIGAISWNRGQPLGLFPSFAVFAATHGLLLWYLNGSKHEDKFFILGDDVVILDDLLHQKYIKYLQMMGCPYSPDKSICSNQICEFAGKVITRESITPQLKWREVSNDNFIDICKLLGHRSRLLLSRRQKAVFDAVKNCCLPLGLNMSYRGSNLVSMMELTDKTFGFYQKKVLDSLVDQREIANRNFYSRSSYSRKSFLSVPQVLLPVVESKMMTFDEKVRLVLQKCLPWFNENVDPRLLSGVPGGLDNFELPPVNLLPSRLTVLDRYETMLNL